MAIMVKSDGEQVTGATLRTVIDGDKDDNDDDDDNNNNYNMYKLIKVCITIKSKICHISTGISPAVPYGTAHNSMNAIIIPFSSCCFSEHLAQRYQISEPAVGHNNEYN